MFRISLKSLLAHKRRLVGTSLSVILGIAFLVGTMVLGDTLKATFNDLFSNVNKGTDAVVRSSTKFGDRGETQRPSIDADLLAKIRQVKGVALAEPNVSGYGVLIGKDGKQVTSNGPPLMAGNWIGDTPLNPYHLSSGRAPKAANEVVIDAGLAKKSKLGVGDSTTVQLPNPYSVRIVGISRFGNADSAGGSTSVDLTTAAAQQKLLGSTSKLTSIRVKASPGTSQEQVSSAVSKALPQGVQAVPGATVTQEQKDAINGGFLNFLTTFLLIFAVIALVVAAFSIYNTFTIIMAQRTQESALMRALGASRRQVLWAVVLETVLVGLIGALIGLFAGLGVALGLSGLFSALGADLPTHALVVAPRTVAVAFVVGVIVTVLAGLLPAIRSARVSPLAAMRDVAVDESGRSKSRLVAGAVLTATALAVVLLGASGKSQSEAGVGAFLLLVGVVVLGPVVAKPAASLLGLPAARLRGVSGRLARENAMRNPRRTASTASALLVGVAVVALFTVVGASITASVNQSVDKSFAGDLVVTSGGFGGGGRGFSPELPTKLNQVPEVQRAAGIGIGDLKINNFDARVAVVKPADLASVLDLGVTTGDLSHLSNQQVAVSTGQAKSIGLHQGSNVTLQLPDGTSSQFQVGAIYKNLDIIQSDYILAAEAYIPHANQVLDQAALIKLKPGVSISKGQDAVQKVADGFVGTKVQNRAQYRNTVAQGVATFLALVYAMLFLAVIIALFGIANTLSLSVYERTREIGLLRAVGGMRRQIRSMVRWESIVVSLFGTVGGILIGIFLGWALIRSASGSGAPTVFDPGLSQLFIVLVVGILVGLLAAIRPARRAARLDVLQAISQ